MSKASRFLQKYEKIGEPSTQKLTVEYANDGCRKAVNTLLATIARLGGWGSSRTIKHWVDGDGSYRINVKGLDKDINYPDTEPSEVDVPGY